MQSDGTSVCQVPGTIPDQKSIRGCRVLPTTQEASAVMHESVKSWEGINFGDLCVAMPTGASPVEESLRRASKC